MIAWRALANRNYRVYFGGYLLSQVGAWVHRLAQAWFVLELTDSALALGLLAIVEFSPMLLLSPIAGALGDRFARRRLLVYVQVVLTLQGLALAWLVLGGSAVVWQVYAFAFLWGVAHALDGPIKHAFIADLVPRADLPSAVGLNAASMNGARILGPALGGVAISTLGIGWCFLFSGLSHLAVLGAIALVRVHAPAAREIATGIVQDVRDGMRYARRAPEIAIPLVILAFMGTFGYNFGVALPLLARYSFDSGALGFGLMNAAMGFGALCGGVLVASRAAPTDRVLSTSAGLFTLLLFAVSRLSQLELAIVVLWCLGFSGVFYTASTQAALQLRTDERFRGRVMGLYTLIFGGLTPLGSGFTGAAANAFGIRDALAINAVICLIGSTAVAWALARRLRGPRPYLVATASDRVPADTH
ncbi:MAG TPA: MFS transporter [Candidatus Limnocylindria bacterium]|nr:MFS transporter [Candidatus Limnocylindria bacterium]